MINCYCSQEANVTAGSFRTPSASLNVEVNLMQLLRATLAQPIATQEAADTCASAAEPPPPETRQAGDYVVAAPAAQAGQWQLIRNSAGEHVSLKTDVCILVVDWHMVRVLYCQRAVLSV
jgi:hypothetical protein